MTTYYMDDARAGIIKYYQENGTTQLAACDTNVTGYDNVTSPYICIVTSFYAYQAGGACNKDITASNVRLEFRQDGGSWEQLGTDVAGYDCSGVNDETTYQTDDCNNPDGANCSGAWQDGKESIDGTTSISITKENWTAILWGVDLTSAVAGSEYEFRVYDTDNTNPVQHASDALGTYQASITMASDGFSPEPSFLNLMRRNA